MVTDAMIAAARDEFIAVAHGFYYPSNEQIRCVLEAAEKAAWMPISEAPTLERVIVSGIQPKCGTCPAYRWYHEDVTDENGVPMDRPNADLFRYLPTPPRVEA